MYFRPHIRSFHKKLIFEETIVVFAKVPEKKMQFVDVFESLDCRTLHITILIEKRLYFCEFRQKKNPSLLKCFPLFPPNSLN